MQIFLNYNQSKLGAMEHSMRGLFIGVIRQGLYVAVPCGNQGLFHNVFWWGLASLHCAHQSSLCMPVFNVRASLQCACQSSMCMPVFNVHTSLHCACQSSVCVPVFNVCAKLPYLHFRLFISACSGCSGHFGILCFPCTLVTQICSQHLLGL